MGSRYTPLGETLPIATALGSPIYGYRSVVRDLEAQFIIVTTNAALRQVRIQNFDPAMQHTFVLSPSKTCERGQTGLQYDCDTVASLVSAMQGVQLKKQVDLCQ